MDNGKEVRQRTLNNGETITQRLLRIEPGFAIWAPERSCCFCKNCSDYVWDYTNGPYMFFCDIANDGKDRDQITLTEKGCIGKCEFFEEDDKVEENNKEIVESEKRINEMRSDPNMKPLLDDFSKAFGEYVVDRLLYGDIIAEKNFKEKMDKYVKEKDNKDENA